MGVVRCSPLREDGLTQRLALFESVLFCSEDPLRSWPTRQATKRACCKWSIRHETLQFQAGGKPVDRPIRPTQQINLGCRPTLRLAGHTSTDARAPTGEGPQMWCSWRSQWQTLIPCTSTPRRTSPPNLKFYRITPPKTFGRPSGIRNPPHQGQPSPGAGKSQSSSLASAARHKRSFLSDLIEAFSVRLPSFCWVPPVV